MLIVKLAFSTNRRQLCGIIRHLVISIGYDLYSVPNSDKSRGPFQGGSHDCRKRADPDMRAKFLPIVAAYAGRIGLVEAMDSQLNCKMEVSPRRVGLARIPQSRADSRAIADSLTQPICFATDPAVGHLS
jgi:hypothetical protein